VDAAYFRDLFGYNDWANAVIIENAVQISDEDYFAEMPGLSFGNLHNTLAHILLAEIAWQMRWEHEPPYDDVPNARATVSITQAQLRTLPELTERWADVERQRQAYLERLTDEMVNAKRPYQLSDGSHHSLPLGYQLAHLVNHGTQFRGEAAVRLTQLEFTPGEIDMSIYFQQHAK
jgi:uncharacterized damage-inducible protein DinB